MNLTVTANYIPIPYTITVIQSDSFTITVSPSQEFYYYGDTLSISVTLSDGCVFTAWNVSGGAVSGETGTDTLTVMGNVTLSAISTTPSLSITAWTSTNWVYQNTPVTTQDRHQMSLTISTTDTWGNNTYSVTLTQTGSGVVTPTQNWIAGTTLTPTGNDPAYWTVPASRTFSGYLVGGRVYGTVNSTGNLRLTGSCTLTVTVQGDNSGPSNLATAQVSFKVRPLGDIDDSGTVTPTEDKKWLNGRLNGDAPYTTYDQNIFNLDGHSGATSPNQKSKVLNLILNGAVVQ